MSKQKIAPTRGEGIPTPGILAETPESGNTSPFSVAAFAEALDTTITDGAIDAMGSSVTTFFWCETLAGIIQEKIDNAAAPMVGKKVVDINVLAAIIKSLCATQANVLSTDTDILRDERLPRLLAALPNGGEA